MSNHENFVQRTGPSFEIEAKKAAIIYALSGHRNGITLVSDKAMKGLQTDILFAAGQCAFVGEAKLVLDHDAFVQLEARERYIRREGAQPQMFPTSLATWRGGGVGRKKVECGLRACSPPLLERKAACRSPSGRLSRLVRFRRPESPRARPLLAPSLPDVAASRCSLSASVRQHADTDPLLAPLRGKALRGLLIGERAEDDSLVGVWQSLGYDVLLRDGKGMLAPVARTAA